MERSLADETDTELGKRWHARRSPAFSSLYEQRQNEAQRQDARVAAWIAGALYVLFSVTDAVLINDVLYYTAAARLAIGAIFIAGIEVQHRRNVRLSLIDRQCAAGVVAAYATWLCLSSYSENHLGASYYMTFGIIFMMVSNLFFNFPFKLALIASGFIAASFYVALLTIFSVTYEYAVAIGTLYFSSYVLTLFVNWKLNEERYRVFLNSLHAEIRQKEAVERGLALLRLSTTDALTGLPNRRATDEELRKFWDRWQTAEESFAVILIDIDYFKRFNDRYGHQEGDRCLVAVAEAMETATARHQCALGRFGGEEFIILTRSGTRDHMALVAEDVRRAVEDLQIVHEQRPDGSHIVTVSVGAAFSGDVAGMKVDRLVTEADRALYGAKAADRNCVRVFDRDDPQRMDLQESIPDLVRTALAQDRVSLVYQPIRCARTGEVLAAEALMRMTTASGTVLSPAVFIPVAERNGAIMDLGKWLIRGACLDIIASEIVPVVSVNVSAVQLKAPGFALSVAALLGEMGIAPGRLALEVTEGLQIENEPEILRTIDELRRLGVKVWLDDFGTGFAGLSCLRKIDFDAVKIDRSFLHASHTPRGAAMLRDILDLVRNAGHAVVVEGVENREQMDLLEQHEVDLLQGFHLGRPVPADALRRLVLGHAPKRLAAISA